MTSSAHRLLPLLLALLLGLATLGGCAPTAESEWLAAAESAHATAASSVDAADGGSGRAALEAFLARPVPAGIQREDARVVRQDAAYRLARLLLAEGDTDEAEQVATAAIEEGRAEDVYTANLFVVRGQALEARGEPVKATMDYHDALLINETLLEAALEAGEEDR